MRVLIAVDDSSSSEKMIHAIKTGVVHEKAEVLVLHVLQPIEPAPPPEMAQNYAPELEEEKQLAHALIDRIARELCKSGFSACSEVRIGDVIQTILDRASEWHADMIMVGSHGQRSLRDFFLGNVAESVARRSCCSVAIIRPPASN